MTLLSIVYKWLKETYPTIMWKQFNSMLAIRGMTKLDDKAIWIETLEAESTDIFVEVYPTTRKFPALEHIKLASTDPKFFEKLADLIGEDKNVI